MQHSSLASGSIFVVQEIGGSTNQLSERRLKIGSEN